MTQNLLHTIEHVAAIGNRTDVAADTASTATVIALLRQIAEAVNKGTGTAIGSNLSLVDIIGAFDGGADPQGDIFQALGVDATNSIKALIDAAKAVIGAKTDAAAEGAVTEADTLMQYAKQLVTEGIARDAVVGALTDAASDTADTSTAIALLRQIAEAINNGTGTPAAENKSVLDVIGDDGSGNSVLARVGDLTDAADSTPNTATGFNLLRAILAACGDLEGTDILARLGALTDVAADTTDTATMIALLRQIAEAVNKGTGTALGDNLSLVDVIGAFDGGADPQGDIYQALGVDTTNSVKALIDAAKAVIGALTDTAADTTDTATAHALLRQIAEAVNNGTGTAIAENLSLVDIIGAFDGGADPQGDIFQALGVDATNSVKALIDAAKAVIGALTDTAVDTTDTATIMNLLRQIAEAVNNGTGTAIGENTSVVDLIAALQADLGDMADAAAAGPVTEADTMMAYVKQLVTELQVVDGLIDTVLALALPAVVNKVVAFDGGAGSGGIGTVALLTITGAVKLKLYAICTETLVGAATLSCGTAGEPGGLIAQIADATTLAVGEIWYDGTPTTLLDDDSAIPFKVIGDGADAILTIGANAITDGTIAFRAEWQPITAGSTVVAAA